MSLSLEQELGLLEPNWQKGMSKEDVMGSKAYARWSSGVKALYVVSHRTPDQDMKRWLMGRLTALMVRKSKKDVEWQAGRYASDFERWWINRYFLWRGKAQAAYEANERAKTYSAVHRPGEVPMSLAERHWWGYVHQAYAKNGRPLSGSDTGEERKAYWNVQGHFWGRMYGMTPWGEVDVLSLSEAWSVHRKANPEDYTRDEGPPYTELMRHKPSEKDWWEELSPAEVLRGMFQDERILKGKRGALYASHPELRPVPLQGELQKHLFRERVGMPLEARDWVYECYRLNYGEPHDTPTVKLPVERLWEDRPIEKKAEVREWGTVELIWSLCFKLNKCYMAVDRYLGLSRGYCGKLLQDIRTDTGGYSHLNPRTTPATRRKLEEAIYNLHPSARPANVSEVPSEKAKAHRSSTQWTILQVEKRLNSQFEHLNRRLDRIETLLEALLGSGEGVAIGEPQKTGLNGFKEGSLSRNGMEV